MAHTINIRLTRTNMQASVVAGYFSIAAKLFSVHLSSTIHGFLLSLSVEQLIFQHCVVIIGRGRSEFTQVGFLKKIHWTANDKRAHAE